MMDDDEYPKPPERFLPVGIKATVLKNPPTVAVPVSKLRELADGLEKVADVISTRYVDRWLNEVWPPEKRK